LKYFIVGALGFIGSNIVHYLLKNQSDCKIFAYDNLSTGKIWHINDVKNDERLQIVIANVEDITSLSYCMAGSDVVIHLASNADIAKAETDPAIDFWNGTYLTQCVLEAMRLSGVKKIIYASGSGVYGNLGVFPAFEDYGPLLPLSTYGASKIAGEALISSYCNMFDMTARAYRFANVVGSNQTHGVVCSFIEKLINDPKKLQILGNGKQSKSYCYVDDIIDGIFLTDKKSKKQYDYFNLATTDYITVNEIADIVVAEMGLSNVEYEYSSNETRGFKGDIGIVRFNTEKARNMGWDNQYSSRESIRKSVNEMLANKYNYNKRSA
jgi:UDP-glucose 4-epimerase